MDPRGAAADRPRKNDFSPSRSPPIGVVYGDIGTSPLYAIRECFHGAHAVALNHENVLGVLSLII